MLNIYLANMRVALIVLGNIKEANNLDFFLHKRLFFSLK